MRFVVQDNAREGKEAIKQPFWGARRHSHAELLERAGAFSSRAEVRAGLWPPNTPSALAGGCLCAHFMHNRSSEERDTVSLLQIQFQLDE